MVEAGCRVSGKGRNDAVLLVQCIEAYTQIRCDDAVLIQIVSELAISRDDHFIHGTAVDNPINSSMSELFQS